MSEEPYSRGIVEFMLMHGLTENTLYNDPSNGARLMNHLSSSYVIAIPPKPADWPTKQFTREEFFLLSEDLVDSYMAYYKLISGPSLEEKRAVLARFLGTKKE